MRYFYLVEESTEKLSNALHDAAKRANIEFLQQALANKVNFIFNISIRIPIRFITKGISYWS